LQILRQAKDNGTSLKVTAGSFPVAATPEEIVVDIRYINRLVGLDTIQKRYVRLKPSFKRKLRILYFLNRVIVEGGMHLSTLTRILESVHLTLDMQGKVPDLTVCDAINAGK
jgi:hypothetical protein